MAAYSRWRSRAASLNLIALEQFIGNRTIAMVFDDAKLLAVSDNLEEDLVVFCILAPAAGLGSPDHTITLNLASIVPNEIVDRPDVAQEQNVAGGPGHADKLRIAVHDRRNGGPANRFRLERRCGVRHRRCEISD